MLGVVTCYEEDFLFVQPESVISAATVDRGVGASEPSGPFRE
ncbi:hypothetical protein MM817_03212 [Acidibacillus sp. S0AB]|uniref:Uncharacterized protein n=1 Tax=Sulfoacidibacillus ferrooxidans TaxID=2005001 RepID=A0A9X2AES7_9BACL|nr:hypothetical protein [Sulfoacidibacillus ferrooxidans]